ncbi:cytochrome P450 [Apiospora saccharicola]
MSSSNLLVSGVLLGIVVWAAINLFQVSHRPGPLYPLPPGPKGKPIVGNLGDLPALGAREWEHWAKHKKLYGPISSVTAFGTTIVVLSTLEGARELLENRSSIYSGRAPMEFGGEMCGWKYMLALRPADRGMRAIRKFLHGAVGTRAALGNYAELQETEVRRLLLRVLEKPEGLRDHIRTEAGAIILKVAYGYEIEAHKEDPLVTLADHAMDQFSKAMIPGAWLVDMVPMLRHFPEWLPGMSFKQTAREWKATLIDLVERPSGLVRKQLAEGRNATSVLSQAYEKSPNMSEEEEHIVKWASGALYSGGADTSVSTMSTFFLVMSLFPDAQRKAQEEIDRVIGTDRLPTLADRERLPYVGAVMSECLRFHPIAPMGLPHQATADDVYEGYRIPKGAIVLSSQWLYSRDESVYPEPETFNPERFLGPNPAPHPEFVFGFGRRVCPGKLLAEQSVWLTVANSLAVFDISGSAANQERKGGSRFTGGIVSHPAPYEATIRPRTPGHEALIREVKRTHPWRESDARELESIKV